MATIAQSVVDDSLVSGANEWLAHVDRACREGDLDAFLDSFLPDAWFRDIFCFSWDRLSMEKRGGIQSYLSEPVADDDEGNTNAKTRFEQAGLHSFALDAKSTLRSPRPMLLPGQPDVVALEGAITFSLTNPKALGRGYIRLIRVPINEQETTWKAFTVMFSLAELCGHEEPIGRPLGVYEDVSTDVRKTWDEVREEEIKAIEEDPTVLIVGAGHHGVMVAARMRHMGIRALVIDKAGRVGDSWRKRYTNLTIHLTARSSTFLYQEYPENYPKYIPKNKFASFIEHYAIQQEIHVWLRTTLLPTAVYDENTQRWSVTLERFIDGSDVPESVVLRPKHIIMATGVGEPRLPDIKGLREGVFKGPIYHAMYHQDSKQYKGKKVVVVGAGSSAADICQDVYSKGASEVIMVQRSPTCLTTTSTYEKVLAAIYTEEAPGPYALQDIDLCMQSMPPRLLLQLAATPKTGIAAVMTELDKEVHDALRKAGFRLTNKVVPDGPDVGVLGFLFEKLASGTMLDQGCSRLIIEGKVKVRSGSVEEVVHDGLVFQDGSRLQADAVILATGLGTILNNVEHILGEEIVKKLPAQLYGLDKGGENVMWKNSGQPGLWFALGDFGSIRLYSKHLALQILAQELGLKKP